MFTININGKDHELDAEPDMPLLWAVRELVQLTGTKYGCGIAQCGACTVQVDGVPTRSCQLTVGDVNGAKITTIEGLSSPIADVLRDTWSELDVVQCGYCQSGQILAAEALLTETRNPTDEDIDEAMQGNLCRCSTYHRIRKAVHLAAKRLEA